MDERLQEVGADALAVHEYRFELLQYQNVQAFAAVIADLRRGRANDWQTNGEARGAKPDADQAQPH